MRHLLAADWVRFGRRRDLWILVALVPLILAIMFVADFNGAVTPPQFNFSMDPPDPVAEAAMRAQMLAEWHQQVITALPAFAFPASLLKVAGNAGPMILLAIYLAIALVAGEFEWGTVRTLHLTSSRGRTLAVRVGVILGLVGIVAAMGLLIAAILPFLLSFEGAPLQQYAAPVPDLWLGIVVRLATVLPFIAVPVLIAVLARSTSLSFLLVLLFFVADLAMTGATFWSWSPVPWIPALTVSGSISRLLGAPDAPLALIAPASVSLAALLAWAVLPVVAAILRFRRLDLNE
ncbi:MAG TPA: ABC transporter permease subunit [Candidatus Limnocylindrales bacterium]|nr:ABC transporter permease subunit [Candidatus Limnocylindrales bacterium]